MSGPVVRKLHIWGLFVAILLLLIPIAVGENCPPGRLASTRNDRAPHVVAPAVSPHAPSAQGTASGDGAAQPAVTPTAPAGQPVAGPETGSRPTATSPPPALTHTPTRAPAEGPTLAPTEMPSPVPTEPPEEPAPPGEPTPTQEPAPTQEPTPTEGPTPAGDPTPPGEPTPPGGTGTPHWNLGRDIIGLWELIEGDDQRTWLDFLENGSVIVSDNGLCPYAIEGPRAIILYLPDGEMPMTVLNLTENELSLQNSFDDVLELHRVPGHPDLQDRVVGLWVDPAGIHDPLEFTSSGMVLGVFGRGTYGEASNSSLLVTCDDPPACDIYREHGQSDDAPLVLRVVDVAEGGMTLAGFGSTEPWAVERLPGTPNLGAEIVGLWEDEYGTTLRFADTGELIIDQELTGSYEVLSETTLWVVFNDDSTMWIVQEISADTLVYIEAVFWESDAGWVYTRRE